MAIVPGLFSALLIAASKAAARFAKTLANRREARQLSEWDARALKDIGLTRSDVMGALSEPITRDPTLYLAMVAAGRKPHPDASGASGAWASPAPPRAADFGDLPSARAALCT